MEAIKPTTTAATHSDSAVLKWFREDEFYWRSLASSIWLAMVLPILFAVFLLAVNISIFSPIAWIGEILTMLLTFSTVSTIFLLQIISSLATIPHAKALTVQKSQLKTNTKFLVFLLRPKQLSAVGCFVAFSFLTTFILKPYCQSNLDNSVFLSLLGVCNGLFYTIMYYKKHSYLAEFPVIPQTRFFRFKKSNQCLRA